MTLSKRKRRISAAKAVTSMSQGFKQIDLTKVEFMPSWMTRAYRNNRFTVMIKDDAVTTHGPAIRVMVQNHFDTPILHHWKEMMNIKNEIFGEEAVAVEYYPRVTDLVDDYNIYWMFIYPKGVLPLPL